MKEKPEKKTTPKTPTKATIDRWLKARGWVMGQENWEKRLESKYLSDRHEPFIVLCTRFVSWSVRMVAYTKGGVRVACDVQSRADIRTHLDGAVRTLVCAWESANEEEERSSRPS